jgi:hypothetical protein
MDLLSDGAANKLKDIIERVSWKLHLSYEMGEKVLEMGTESVKLSREWRNLERDLPVSELRSWEREFEAIDQEANRLLTGVSRRNPKVSAVCQFLKDRGTEETAWLEGWTSTDEHGISSIDGLRRMQTQLERHGHIAQLKIKLIRSLISQTAISNNGA